MNNNVSIIKDRFCQFDCPIKSKNNFKELLDLVQEDMDYFDDIEYSLENIKRTLKFHICECCPLENFIRRLEEEKIIEGE
jgi:hypothetical protein